MEHLLSYPTVKESPFYEKVRGGRIRCLVCERGCIIADGERGFCGTRANIGGRLYTLVYGDLSALESRPIEIKPFYHFYPGSSALTFSTWSCNFRCPWCQNFAISTALPDPPSAKYVPPSKLVEIAIKQGDDGLCASFNEPTLLLEYTLDAFRLARERGLYSTYVSNGYMSEKALKALVEAGLTGLKVDVKGDEEVYRRVLGARCEVPWRNVKLAKELGVHVEVVFLVVTGVSDREDVIRDVIEKHLKYAGEDVPLHINRYFPAHKYWEPPTPVEVLEWACELARREGVKFVYLGNVPGHRYSHTYCPRCGELLIKRYNFDIIEYRLTEDKRCPRCGEEIPITGRYVRKGLRWIHLF